jgi:hypothetical protein
MKNLKKYCIFKNQQINNQAITKQSIAKNLNGIALFFGS